MRYGRVVLDLMLGGEEGQPVIHVGSESGPLTEPLDGAFLPREYVSCLLKLLLIPLQVADALSLQQVELLVSVLVQGDLLVHVGVEAEIGVGREEAIKHGVNLWRGREGGVTREVRVRTHKKNT